MRHTTAGIERRRAELRTQRDELMPQLTALHRAADALRSQAGRARMEKRWGDAGDIDRQITNGQPAIDELAEAGQAISGEDEALVKAGQALTAETNRLLAAMRDALQPYLALSVTGPEWVEREIAPLRKRYAEITGGNDGKTKTGQTG